MNRAYLLTGGNMGDRLTILQQAKVSISKHCGQVVQASPIYETEAWGYTDQAPFLNQALEIDTTLAPAELLNAILQIEQSLGRSRSLKYGPRTIDIDILLYGSEVIATPDLKIPHPELTNRRFALQCLAAIAPNFQHPILHTTIQDLLAACTDPLKVYKYSG